MELKEIEHGLMETVICPIMQMGYVPLLQPWMDGWLVHIYKQEDFRSNGLPHETTVGGVSLADCMQKIKVYHESKQSIRDGSTAKVPAGG